MLQFLIILYVSYICLAFAQNEDQFIYNGFLQAKLQLDGTAEIQSNGLLQLTNTKNVSLGQVGHAFFKFPLKFNTTSSSGITPSLSFSTNFVFVIVPLVPTVGAHGIAFAISATRNFSHAGGNQYLGIFSSSNNGLPANHILAIELDTVLNPEFGDIDKNHVGIDVNSLNSTESVPAMYFSNKDEKNMLGIKTIFLELVRCKMEKNTQKKNSHDTKIYVVHHLGYVHRVAAIFHYKIGRLQRWHKNTLTNPNPKYTQ
jgi:hypothetical protein